MQWQCHATLSETHDLLDSQVTWERAVVMSRTCFEAQLVLLLSLVVIERSHAHSASRTTRVFLKGVGATISLIARIRCRLLIVRPFSWVGLILVIAADTGENEEKMCSIFKNLKTFYVFIRAVKRFKLLIVKDKIQSSLWFIKLWFSES